MITKKQHHRVASRRWCNSRKWAVEALEARYCLTSYTTLDLMPLSGHDWSSAGALNGNGLAVGSSRNDVRSFAVVWQVDEDGNVEVGALPGPDGENSSAAYDVNSLGMIVGQSNYDAVVWTGSFGSYVPHQLAGGARQISEPDQDQHVWVVGDSTASLAALWKLDANGNLLSTTELGPADGETFVPHFSDVQVAGSSVLVAGWADNGAAVWEFSLSGGLLRRTDLGTLGGDFSWGWAINSQGAVAGDSYLAGNYVYHAFVYENGVMTDLGSLGNSNVQASALNDANVVVGNYENRTPPTINSGEHFAFVWEDGTMYDLMSQVSDRQFWRLFYATDVNADGEIVGTGSFGTRRDNQPHGFLARPEGVAGTTMHVGDLDGASTSGSRGKWNATVTITVHSGEETPLEGATVSGTWSGGATGSSSCVTNAAGQCSVTKSKLSGSSVTFTVDTITLSSATYAPGDNHDPDGDSDGTVITVSSGTSAAAIAAAIASQDTVQSIDAVFESVADDSETAEQDDPLSPSHRMNMAAVARLAISVAPPAAKDRLAALGFDAVLDVDGGLKEASLLDVEFDDFIGAGWM